jgi:hypothetical protein
MHDLFVKDIEQKSDDGYKDDDGIIPLKISSKFLITMPRVGRWQLTKPLSAKPETSVFKSFPIERSGVLKFQGFAGRRTRCPVEIPAWGVVHSLVEVALVG